MATDIGTLEKGKYADLGVWNTDFYNAPTDSIKEASCEMTLFNGQVVYRAEDATDAESPDS